MLNRTTTVGRMGEIRKKIKTKKNVAFLCRWYSTRYPAWWHRGQSAIRRLRGQIQVGLLSSLLSSPGSIKWVTTFVWSQQWVFFRRLKHRSTIVAMWNFQNLQSKWASNRCFCGFFWFSTRKQRFQIHTQTVPCREGICSATWHTHCSSTFRATVAYLSRSVPQRSLFQFCKDHRDLP